MSYFLCLYVSVTLIQLYLRRPFSPDCWLDDERQLQCAIHSQEHLNKHFKCMFAFLSFCLDFTISLSKATRHLFLSLITVWTQHNSHAHTHIECVRTARCTIRQDMMSGHGNYVDNICSLCMGHFMPWNVYKCFICVRISGPRITQQGATCLLINYNRHRSLLCCSPTTNWNWVKQTVISFTAQFAIER